MKNKKLDKSDSASASAFDLDRRQFLRLVGSGIIVSFIPALPWIAPETPSAVPRDLPKDFNAFLKIGEDGRVSCFTGKVEMGQGIVTSLAQMLAEELDVPLTSVDMVMGDTDLCPWDAGTYGSMSTKCFGPPLRAPGGEARAILIQLASERLGVPPEKLKTQGGVVMDGAHPKKQVSYGDLTKGKRIEKHLGRKPALKPIADFTISGKHTLRTDAVEKVTGKTKYSGDISLPGMLYARILRPPAHGAKLTDADTSGVEKIPGAQVIRNGDLIAVVHSSPDMTEKALDPIQARFSRPHTDLNDANIFEHLLSVAPP